jgi:hypothetical protein
MPAPVAAPRSAITGRSNFAATCRRREGKREQSKAKQSGQDRTRQEKTCRKEETKR